MSDQNASPFEALALPVERQEPRPSFARELRARLVRELGLDDDPPTVQLPERKQTMTTTTRPTTTRTPTTLTPYLTAHDAAAAIDWYTEAFGAVEAFRVVADDGAIGHAEITIGTARIALSDEHPGIGVVSPITLGGTPFALHLEVADVDAVFQRAVDAGAVPQAPPEDQPHGARHGTLLDPFGHRWMLSQTFEELSIDEYAQRAEGSGYTVQAGPGGGASAPSAANGSIWAAVHYADALAGIRFMVDVLGFEEQLIVTDPDDPTVVVHSQIRWPEGGIVQAGTATPRDDHDVFRRPPGSQSLYVITTDPQSVWERCRAAGVEVVREPESPDYDPDGISFSVRDPEGNVWSFGTYAGEG